MTAAPVKDASQDRLLDTFECRSLCNIFCFKSASAPALIKCQRVQQHEARERGELRWIHPIGRTELD